MVICKDRVGRHNTPDFTQTTEFNLLVQNVFSVNTKHICSPTPPQLVYR